MAASKKSAKRSPAKKRPAAKTSRSKKPAGKAKAATSKRRPRKASTRAKGGLDTVRQVGEKTWKTLKSTTAQVVEGVKETFGG